MALSLRPGAVVAGICLTLTPQMVRASALVPQQPEPDPRLEKSLRLEFPYEAPLSDICWVVSQRTGVAHKPVDEATGDLRASVVGKVTLRQLHRGMAEVLGVQWKRAGATPGAGYVVERLPAFVAQETREQVEWERARRANVAQLLDWAELAEPRISQLPQPWPEYVRAPGCREATQLLRVLSPPRLSAVLEGLRVVVPVASLSAEAKERVLALRMDNPPAPHPTGGALPPAIEVQNLDDGQLIVEPGKSQTATGPYPIRFELRVPGKRKRFYVLRVPAPDTPSLRPPGSYRLPSSDEAVDAPKMPQPFVAPQLKSVTTWPQVIIQLERATGLPVISDAYRLPNDGDPVKVEGRPGESLEEFLDRVCYERWNRRWGRAGLALVFQRIAWPLCRAKQVAASDMRRWRKHVADSGRVSLQDLVEMAQLKPGQQAQLSGVMCDEIAETVAEHREFLLLWGGLPEGIRRRGQVAGILPSELPPALQPLARSLVGEALRTATAVGLDRARLRITSEPEFVAYTIVLPGTSEADCVVPLQVAPAAAQRIRDQERSRLEQLAAAARAPGPSAGD